jgi:hypothetical protein
LEPYFAQLAPGQFAPNDSARGGWDSTALHGRVVAGLLAHHLEGEWGRPGFRPARLTVDLFRPVPVAPVEVVSEPVREGTKVRVADARLSCEGVPVARAIVVFLATSENPAGAVWSPPDWDASLPEDLSNRPGDGMPMWDTRPIDHPWRSAERKRAWVRANRPVVAGAELTPFVRAASVADFTNPFANSGEAGLQFVNADVTLYLHRLPVGEWIGFEVTSHHAADGIAVATCALYDEAGGIGRTAVCSVATRRSGTAT